MAQLIPYELKPEVGIERDGTSYDTQKFTNGSWVRFYREHVQKMGGYTIIDNGNSTIIRNIFSINAQNSIVLYIGRPTGLSYIIINEDMSTSAEFNVTPAGFVENDNITWSLSTVSYNDVDYILAMPLPNATDISNTTPGTLYSGVIATPIALTPVAGAPSVTGGVTTVGSYIFLYGSNGVIFWNNNTDLTTWPVANKIVFESTQFVYGAPVRSGPTLSALFWGLDFVAQLSLNSATPPTFVSNYVSTQSTLLSANCIVSLDPYFYWIGNNSFYQFNASVVEFSNITNKEWFFTNLNRSEKEKVFGFANRIYNEIWWLFPYGDATENTNAIITQLDAQSWFDTDNIPRTCAISSSTQFPYPLMCSSEPVPDGATSLYPIWAHEYGTDQVQLGQTIALTATFESNWITASDIDPSMDVAIIDTIIPDIQQIGDMTVSFNLRGYPQSLPVVSDTYTLSPTTEFITVRQKASIFSATFTSNVAGGNFLMGKTKFLLKSAGDERMGPSAT
jgi:hypothetical protein